MLPTEKVLPFLLLLSVCLFTDKAIGPFPNDSSAPAWLARLDFGGIKEAAVKNRSHKRGFQNFLGGEPSCWILDSF